MKQIIFLFALFGNLSAIHATSTNCVKIGLLGEFILPTGSTSQPFGEEILRGINVAQALSEKAERCTHIYKIDIANSVANIPGYIKKAARIGIRIFIGLGTSEQAVMAVSSLDETGSVLFTPTASSNDLSLRSNRTIMLFPRNADIAKTLAQEAKRRGFKKVIAAYAKNNIYSSDIYNDFKKYFSDNRHVVLPIALRSGAATAEPIASLIQKNPDYDAIFLPLFELDVARILSGLAASHTPVKKIIATDAWGTYSYVISKLASMVNLKGLQPEIYSPSIGNPINRRFVRAYKAKYRRLPSDLAAFSFDSYRLALKMITVCLADPSQWDVLHCLKASLPFHSTTGSISTAQKGALNREVKFKDIDISPKNSGLSQ